MKRILQILGVGLVAALALLIGFWSGASNRTAEVNSSGLVQQVKQVLKVVTVEGHFVELYDYKDYYYYDWPIFQKKAIVKAKAKVLMGYDFTSVDILVEPDDKKVILSHMPEVETMSMDIQKSYYDLQEGTFNNFQMKDYNKMDKDIRALIEQRVADSGLEQSAQNQLHQLLETLREMLAMQGWELQILNQVPEGQKGSFQQ